MSNFFNRKYKIIIGNEKDGGLEIVDLRVSFNVELSLVGYPNMAEIKIYNLNKQNRNKIKKEFTKIFLNAGYSDNLSLIFSGDIVNVTHEKKEADWITVLYCGDTIKTINSSTINKTLPAGQTTESIFNELVSNMKDVTKGVTDGLKDCMTKKMSLLRGLVLSGSVKEWLDKLSKNCGFDYSINNGVIETTYKDRPFSDEPALIIEQNNGMIGSPEVTEIGIKVKSLLLPNIKLGRKIEIKSISAKINVGNMIYRKIPPIAGEGTYFAYKINHIGDTMSDDWFTQIEGKNF